MSEKAWNIITGLYNLCYNELGLAFQMPEALMKDTEYRSLGYMRALGIWSIQYALDDLSNQKLSQVRVKSNHNMYSENVVKQQLNFT